MAKRKKLTLEQKKARPNNEYWREKADEEFMVQFRGKPCEVCEKLGYINTDNTVFHHIVCKKQSKSLRYDKRNGIILCPAHHKLSNEMSAHSGSQLVNERFNSFCWENFPKRMDWIDKHERINFRYTFKEAFEHMKNSDNIEFTYDTESLPF